MSGRSSPASGTAFVIDDEPSTQPDDSHADSQLRQLAVDPVDTLLIRKPVRDGFECRACRNWFAGTDVTGHCSSLHHQEEVAEILDHPLYQDWLLTYELDLRADVLERILKERSPSTGAKLPLASVLPVVSTRPSEEPAHAASVRVSSTVTSTSTTTVAIRKQSANTSHVTQDQFAAALVPFER